MRTALSGIIALACGTGAVAAPPQQPVTVNGITLAAVPGLSRAVNSSGVTDIPRGNGNPTLGRCLSDWNTHAPQATLRWLGAQAPRPAHVKIGTFTARGVTSRFCVVEVSLRANKLLLAYLHRRDADRVWKGIIASPASKFGLPPSEFDTSVRENGTIRPA
jgi:hypothetical protein